MLLFYNDCATTFETDLIVRLAKRTSRIEKVKDLTTVAECFKHKRQAPRFPQLQYVSAHSGYVEINLPVLSQTLYIHAQQRKAW